MILQNLRSDSVPLKFDPSRSRLRSCGRGAGSRPCDTVVSTEDRRQNHGENRWQTNPLSRPVNRMRETTSRPGLSSQTNSNAMITTLVMPAERSSTLGPVSLSVVRPLIAPHGQRIRHDEEFHELTSSAPPTDKLSLHYAAVPAVSVVSQFVWTAR